MSRLQRTYGRTSNSGTATPVTLASPMSSSQGVGSGDSDAVGDPQSGVADIKGASELRQSGASAVLLHNVEFLTESLVEGHSLEIQTQAAVDLIRIFTQGSEYSIPEPLFTACAAVLERKATMTSDLLPASLLLMLTALLKGSPPPAIAPQLSHALLRIISSSTSMPMHASNTLSVHRSAGRRRRRRDGTTALHELRRLVPGMLFQDRNTPSSHDSILQTSLLQACIGHQHDNTPLGLNPRACALLALSLVMTAGKEGNHAMPAAPTAQAALSQHCAAFLQHGGVVAAGNALLQAQGQLRRSSSRGSVGAAQPRKRQRIEVAHSAASGDRSAVWPAALCWLQVLEALTQARGNVALLMDDAGLTAAAGANGSKNLVARLLNFIKALDTTSDDVQKRGAYTAALRVLINLTHHSAAAVEAVMACEGQDGIAVALVRAIVQCLPPLPTLRRCSALVNAIDPLSAEGENTAPLAASVLQAQGEEAYDAHVLALTLVGNVAERSQWFRQQLRHLRVTVGMGPLSEPLRFLALLAASFGHWFTAQRRQDDDASIAGEAAVVAAHVALAMSLLMTCSKDTRAALMAAVDDALQYNDGANGSNADDASSCLLYSLKALIAAQRAVGVLSIDSVEIVQTAAAVIKGQPMQGQPPAQPDAPVVPPSMPPPSPSTGATHASASDAPKNRRAAFRKLFSRKRRGSVQSPPRPSAAQGAAEEAPRVTLSAPSLLSAAHKAAQQRLQEMEYAATRP